MSANNDPIEVTVDKRGNVIILIDRHNLSAAEVLDMAARAMLAAGYDKSQILQAALAYGGRYATDKGAAPASAIAPPTVTPEPPKVTAVESSKPLLEKTSLLPETPAASKEVVATESKDLPAVPSVDKEPKAPEVQEIAAAAKLEDIPPVADIIAADTEVPVVITPAPEPAAVPVAVEKPQPVAATPAPAELPAPAPVASTPPPLPAIVAAEVKSEPEAASPPPFEVPPLAKAPAIPLRVPAVPVSVMGTPAASKEEKEDAAPAEKPAKSKMDEILEADRKRIQALIAANTDTKTPDESVSAAPENTPVTPSIPITAAPLTPKLVVPPVPVVHTPKSQDPEPTREMAAEQEDWQGQKFDPATSTSMLIPPMPGMTDDDNQEYAPVADTPLSPPPLPRKPVSVVTPAMMARPITAEVAPTPPANVPPPPAGGPVSLMSRITGFVKLNTIAIPHYQAETVESTINTPKPMTPSVLSPQPPPTPAKR